MVSKSKVYRKSADLLALRLVLLSQYKSRYISFSKLIKLILAQCRPMASSTFKHKWTKDSRVAKVEFKDGGSAESTIVLCNDITVINFSCNATLIVHKENDKPGETEFEAEFVVNPPHDTSGKYSYSCTAIV